MRWRVWIVSFFLFSSLAICSGKEALYLRLLSDNGSDRNLALVELEHLSSDEKNKTAISIIQNDPKWAKEHPHSLGNDARVLAAFKRIKPEAILALTSSFKDKNPDIRHFAAYCLGSMGPASIPSILKAFKDKSPLVRYCGADSVVWLYDSEETNEEIKEVVPGLIGLLSDPDVAVRDIACQTFGGLGTNGAPAVPFLAERLKDKDIDVRNHALHALGMIGPSAKSVAAKIVEMLYDKNKATRGEAANALNGLGKVSKVVLPSLLKALQDPDINVRYGVINSIGNIGPEAKEAVPTLIKFLSSADEGVRWNSAMAITEIDPTEAERTIPVFTLMLQHEGMKDTAITYLKKIGTPKALKAAGL